MFNNFFISLLITLWNKVENVGRVRPQVTIWHMRIACWMPNATIHTHTQRERERDFVILFAYPLQQCYVIRILPILLSIVCVWFTTSLCLTTDSKFRFSYRGSEEFEDLRSVQKAENGDTVGSCTIQCALLHFHRRADIFLNSQLLTTHLSPYSPYLAQCDIWLSLRLKIWIRVHSFVCKRS